MLANDMHLPSHTPERRLKLLILGFRRSDSSVYALAASPVIRVLICRAA